MTAVPVPTAAPVIGVAKTTEYSEAAQLLRSGGPLALADAHGETPRHGGKFLANNWEPVPSYDSHQITFGGVFVSTAPAYNGLLAQSPYDPLAQQIIRIWPTPGNLRREESSLFSISLKEFGGTTVCRFRRLTC